MSARNFDLTSLELRDNILQFYSDLSAPIETKKDPARWQSVLTELDQLKSVAPVPIVADTLGRRSLPVPETKVVRAVPPAIVIGFLGGFVGHDNLVHSEVQLATRLREAYPLGVHVETFESYRGSTAHKEILSLLDTDHDGTLTPGEKQNARIILYGHSWGGSEAIALARELEKDGIPVLLTIQVDSISELHHNDAVIPANAAQAANFYQPSGVLHGQPKIRAADPTRTRIIGNFRFELQREPLSPQAVSLVRPHLGEASHSD